MSFGQYSNSARPLTPAKPPKEKKLKAVFDTSEVPHVWAHPRDVRTGSGFEQTHARNPQHNLYFKTEPGGARILHSYRDSYPIGSRLVMGKGKKARTVFLVRSDKPYSVTTSGHMNMCASAARNNGEVFHVPSVSGYTLNGLPDKNTHTANLTDYLERIQKEVSSYEKARAVYAIESSHREALSLTQEAKRYAKLFRLKLPALPKVPKLDTARIEQTRTKEAQRQATRTEREARQKAEELARCAEQIEAWKRGDGNTPGWGWNRLTPYALLRVLQDAQTGLHCVETSQGVQVPITGKTGAGRLLRTLEALKASGRTYHTNGHSEHIGQFTVTSFDGSILKAGCHAIQWEEVQRVADAVRIAESKDLERESRTGDTGSILA
jgi:hypothetical protein